MSNLLMTYLNYMTNWSDESVDKIDNLIEEYHKFLGLGDFDSDAVIDNVFNGLVGEAIDVRDSTIAADALQLAADASAAAAIWSFGLSMAAFFTFETASLMEEAYASAEARQLNEQLKNADADISEKIGPKVAEYVAKYKQNNDMFKAMAAPGVDSETARAILFRFMATVRQKSGMMNAATFIRYARSARVVLKDKSAINKVYDALDAINLSGRRASDKEIQQLMQSLKGLESSEGAKYGVDLVHSFVFYFATIKADISKQKLQNIAEEEGVGVEDLDPEMTETYGAMDMMADAFNVTLAVVSAVLAVFNIYDVVEQTKELVVRLNGQIRQQYKDYFNGIKKAAMQYKRAIKVD